MAGSGHIAGVINHPDAKPSTSTGPTTPCPATLEEWQAGAIEHPGSWWPHWRQWLTARSGSMVPARDPATGTLSPIEAAPGSYVKVRA
jgi:polyhydroxyalkanoate synthase